MPKTTYPDCPCCGPCCSLTCDDNLLYATLTDCTLDPEPVPLNLDICTADTKRWVGFYDCDDCTMEISLLCDRVPFTESFIWSWAIQRDSGPPACNRCTAGSDQLGIDQTINCSPLELTWTGIVWTAPGCDKCACNPATGTATLVITQ